MEAGSGFTARDIRTGDRLDVRERTASRQLEPGMMLCGRLVPAGDTVQIFGGMEPVALHERDELIAVLDSELEPEELVAFLTRRFAPPVLLNTENEPSVMCEAVLRCADPAALTAALDAAYERVDDELTWHETITTQGESRIRATLALVGDKLTVETNSENRMDRVLGRLHDLEVEFDMVAESNRSIEDLQEAMGRASSEAAAQEVDPTDPAIAAAVEQVVRGWETTWLDEPIPALSGVTPREAAADPTRRPDLIRLLDSFGPGGPGQMDPRRIRNALGL